MRVGISLIVGTYVELDSPRERRERKRAHLEGPTSIDSQFSSRVIYFTFPYLYIDSLESLQKRLSHRHNNFLNLYFQTFST